MQTMSYRSLGHSGLKVSPLCLGAMLFGDRTELAVARRIVDAAHEAGVNFIDTANSYAKGESERIVGQCIAARRDDWVLATKVFNQMGSGPNRVGLSRRWLLSEVDSSLRRLGTDYIDVWYFHRDDRETPLEETLSAVGDIIRSGKVRYFGLSNFYAWRVAEAVHLCRSLGVPPPIAVQPMYNVVNRQVEHDLLPCSSHLGLGVVTFSPLARGILTGKYRPGEAPPPDSRAGRKDPRIVEDEYRPESLAIAQHLTARAAERGMTPSQFALNWVLANRLVTSVLAGPRTAAQWHEYLGALEHALDDGDEQFVDALVKPGHASTPFHTDPKFPVRGRVVV
jgi:aryl-alcohol dehydrogenase (NADP+)